MHAARIEDALRPNAILQQGTMITTLAACFDLLLAALGGCSVVA